MSKNIYLYLFVFTALIALYLGMMGNSGIARLEEKLSKSEKNVKLLQDSLMQSELERLELGYFGLVNNDDALAYIDSYNLENPVRYISDKLLETNEQEGDNPLVPYQGMDGVFKINKIKILNHRWIIADFSDGIYWGELLLSYEINEDLSVSFTLLNHLLYSRSN
jgi:hypothetical protein